MNQLTPDDIPALEEAIETCMKPGPATRWLLEQTAYLRSLKEANDETER
jgi:hypothetical protein